MKLIDFLLRLYPEEFRARFGADMRAFDEERAREPRRFAVVRDHVATAAAEHLRAIRPDVAYALRGIARRPAFAAIIIATIALGVGANAAIFGVVNAILVPRPD